MSHPDTAGCDAWLRPARSWHAVGGKHDLAIGGDFIKFLDKDRALRFQRLDNGAVMDDFVPDIDRRAITADCFFHHTDGAIDTGAEPARASQQ